MNWVELSREESSKLFDQFCESGEFSFKEEYQSLREDMCLLFENALKEIGITEDQIQQKNYSYQLDLRFGIKLYTTLNQKYGMNVRFAATEGIWRYLSVCVVPDLIEKRYGKLVLNSLPPMIRTQDFGRVYSFLDNPDEAY